PIGVASNGHRRAAPALPGVMTQFEFPPSREPVIELGTSINALARRERSSAPPRLDRQVRPEGAGRYPSHGFRRDADRVVRKCGGAHGLDRGYSAHPMRASFISSGLESGAQPEDVQTATDHRDPSTTKFYDRCRYKP